MILPDLEQNLRKEQNLNGKSETKVQSHNDNQQDLACLDIGSAQHRIQIPNQEDTRGGKSYSDEDPVQDGNWRPRN